MELAQYEYRLPRLTRMWTHLIRQAGGRAGGSFGGVGLRGPGETQLESDRRVIKRRITRLKKQLEEVRFHRKHYRVRRKKSGIKVVALVGYTNAGKSSLLNTLSKADVIAEDKLFATLDPTTRRVRLPGGGVVLFTDTVGFIKKLPHNVVAAFRATLEGITEADVILHVADISHPMVSAQIETTENVLREQGAGDKPSIIAWNKCDLVASSYRPGIDCNENFLTISARTGKGIDKLLLCIENIVNKTFTAITLEIPYEEGGLLQSIFNSGQVNNIIHTNTGTKIQALVPPAMLDKFREYRVG